MLRPVNQMEMFGSMMELHRSAPVQSDSCYGCAFCCSSQERGFDAEAAAGCRRTEEAEATIKEEALATDFIHSFTTHVVWYHSSRVL